MRGWLRLGIACAALAAVACNTVGSVQRALRDPGERISDFPEQVWQEYDCDGRRLPFLRVEKVQLVPKRVRAGEDFNHRIVYALCPETPTAVVSGRLQTRILFRGHAIVHEHQPVYELKPGRWVVDAFVTVPEHAETGVYSMELDFDSESLHFEERRSFAVHAAE